MHNLLLFLILLIFYSLFVQTCRSPLKIFISVSICCLFSTMIAGSGLYKAVSEDKYANLKNIHHDYDAITTDMEQDEKDDDAEKGEEEEEEEEDETLSLQERGTEGLVLGCFRELFPTPATLFLCAVGFLASYGEGGKWNILFVIIIIYE